jgi:hypothetical protein
MITIEHPRYIPQLVPRYMVKLWDYWIGLAAIHTWMRCKIVSDEIAIHFERSCRKRLIFGVFFAPGLIL